ncbi:MAG: tol-pal system-associated acyl-CoA thioesterase [Nitrococcus sp.]|nr:tol-pal system-associated acyl-CoA thioesterase [Nitrococcus sp.]
MDERGNCARGQPRVFHWPIRVYYEDTDSGGVVYHTSYLRFMERARTEWLRAIGFEQDWLRREHGLLFTVRSVRIDFLMPGFFNDQLAVDTWAACHRRVSLRFTQHIRQARDDNAKGKVLCRAEIEVVCVGSQNLRPRPIPSAIYAELMNVG